MNPVQRKLSLIVLLLTSWIEYGYHLVFLSFSLFGMGSTCIRPRCILRLGMESHPSSLMRVLPHEHLIHNQKILSYSS